VMMISVVTEATETPVALRIDGGNISIEFDNYLHSRIISRINTADNKLGNFTASEFIKINDKNYKEFLLKEHSVTDMEDKIGKGKQYKIESDAENLKKELIIITYEDFPTMLFMQVEYTNNGDIDLKIEGWTNNNYEFDADRGRGDNPPFWSYQPGSYGWDNDWIQPLKKDFKRENCMGMNWVDYGGGTPVVDIWRRDVGLAVGHIETVPKLVSLPVSMPTDEAATIAVTYKNPVTLKPGESFRTFRTFIAVHRGDHFQTLSEYRKVMVHQGIEFKNPPQSVYESIWCGWGYEEDFTIEEFYGTFPMIRKLGLEQIVLDYGWNTGVGDYHLHPEKFPNGDADMKKVVNDIHAIGAKAKLWWMPLSVHPSTDMYQKNSDYLLHNKDGSPVFIEFFKSFLLCPASEEVINLTREFLIEAMQNWGWDGFKIDGNHLNTVPPCYNPDHHHSYPEESVEKLPQFFKMIYETALEINPEAVVEICPCGTNYSFFILPYMNQAVASDPSNSWQIRQKGKTLKALSGSKVAFYGDHVELSDNGSDFASTVGVGGVIGTKFVWPVTSDINSESGDINLTPEKEKEWARWINIYKDKMLPLGIYRGDLYDIGYDQPEGHVIQKGDTLYYSFYSEDFTGEIELRGLLSRNYRLTDYVNQLNLGNIKGPKSRLKTSFKKYLLLEALPE